MPGHAPPASDPRPPPFPGGCLRLDYPAGTLDRAELALPRLRDVVRLVPRWRLDNYVARMTDGQERHG